VPRVDVSPPPVILWDLDLIYEMATGNVTTLSNLVKFQPSGVELSPQPGMLTRTNNAAVVPVCGLRDIGTVWRIGNAANRQWIVAAGANVPLLQLPAGVISPAGSRVTIWSCFLRWLNPAAAGFGRHQCFALVPITNTNLFTTDNGATTGAQVGLWGNLAAAPNPQLSFATKRPIAAAGVETGAIPVPWPRALTLWTEVALVLLGATAVSDASISLWLDGRPVTGASFSAAQMPDMVGEALNSGGWLGVWGCAGNLYPGMELQVYRPRLRQGRYLPNGVELFA
jgi:hypothetical protein